jgi:hypothetical protein
MSTMDLWHSVEKTDPKHVKKITGKPYEGSSPNPYSLVMRATEKFGPVGIGWGFTIIKEEIVQGAMISPGFYQQHHKATVRVWYEWNNKRGEVEHIGQTEFSGQRANGKLFTDEDACKKSVTDALGKALSFLGFSGDIFIGRWDDSKYQAELRREFSGTGQANSAAVAAAQKIVPATTKDELLGYIKSSKDLAELNAIVHNDANRALFNGLDDAQANEVADAIDARRTALLAPGEKAEVKKEPTKAATKAEAKSPPEKTPAAASGHADGPVYDQEASKEATAAMLKALKPIHQMVEDAKAMDTVDEALDHLKQAKVELGAWVKAHGKEKAMLIDADKSLVTLKFNDLQSEIREAAHRE